MLKLWMSCFFSVKNVINVFLLFYLSVSANGVQQADNKTLGGGHCVQ